MVILRAARLLGARGAPVVDLVTEQGTITAIRPVGDHDASARVVDVGGRWVMPGLWDAHVHMTQWASTRHRLDLSGAASRAACLDAVAGRLQDQAPTELLGGGVWHVRWTEPPTTEALDAVTGAVPTVLVSGDVHSAWLNSAARRRYGIGTGDGLVRENEWFALMPRLGADIDRATIDAWVADAGRAAAARGVVGLTDFESGDNLGDWARRVEQGFDTQRVRASVWPEHLEAAIARGLRTGDAVPGTAGMVRMGPLKVISDGSLNTRTAYCHDEFAGGGHGALNVTPQRLEELVRRAGGAGVEAAVHAIGDRANEVVLDVFARTGARGSVEHAQLLAPADVPRFAALGVTASVQPEHAMDDRDVAEHLWPGRTARAYPLADLHRTGAVLAFGSDAPVSPLDPWYAISAAVTRSRDGREPWHPEQRLGVDVALRSSWGGVASLSPGGPADLILLDRDPLATPEHELRTMPVAATVVAGRFTHTTL